MKRCTSIVAAVVASVITLTGCTANELPEPDPADGSKESDTAPVTVTETLAEKQETVDSKENQPSAPLAPELGPDEVLLEGTIRKLKLIDMATPESRENIEQFADQLDHDYYVIELDEPKPIEANQGGFPVTNTPQWAILAMLKLGEQLDSQFRWMQDVGRTVRVIGNYDKMHYGTDISQPPTALVLDGSNHPPEFLN